MSRRTSIMATAGVAGLALTALVPGGAQAQALLDRSIRTGPQVVTYEFGADAQQKITQFAFPIAIQFPLFNRVSVDLATAYAKVKYEDLGTTQEIDGLTDTQLRATYALGTDNVVFTLGLNLPTGQETVDFTNQGIAAGLIGNDYLAFPVSNMGTGFAGTGGLAVARAMGAWNLGAGVSFRRTVEFEPFEQQSIPGATEAVRFQPGDEYRFRAGVDRAVGSGSFALGATYYMFGEDDIGAATTYSSGDRVLGQVSWSHPWGPTTLALAAWDLYRMEGKLSTSEDAPKENIANFGAALGFRLADRLQLEPNAEYRRWSVDGASTSNMGLFGVRARMDAGRFAFVPSVSMVTGSLTPIGTTTSDDLTGWRGVLTVQWR